MDFVNKIANGQSTSNTSTTGTAQPAGQKDDYGDKVFAAGAKQSGHNVPRETQEKITDGARGLYEKVSGKPVNSKFSN